MITDWDDAYANGAYINDAAAYPPKWAADAAAFRDGCANAELNVQYGAGERNTLDLFHLDGHSKGLVVFVHGGYWRAFDKSFWSHLAAGPLAAGWAVAMPSYTLAPNARIAEITQEIGAAITCAAGLIAGPVRLTGHSAGGHLVSRMICADSPLSADVSQRIAKTVSISGVHDLRPLLRTELNDDLRIDADEARAESPVLLNPVEGSKLTCWVGADERPEFVRQNALLANVWTGLGAETDVVEEVGRHHFDVIDGLAYAKSPLTKALLA
ncbi:MAG: alpha/beta hydrolase [Pikeienuella sp.]